MGKFRIADIIFDFNIESKILNERLIKYQVSDTVKEDYKVSTFYVDEIRVDNLKIYKEFNNRILCKSDSCDKIFILKNKDNQVVLKIEYFNNDKNVKAYFKKDVKDLILRYNLISMLVNEFFFRK